MTDELRRALLDPGFTPPRTALAKVVDLLHDEELGKHAERALLSAGPPAAELAAERLGRDDPNSGPALVRFVGKSLQQSGATGSVPNPQLFAALVSALGSRHAATRRQAAQSLGKTGRNEAEAPLLAELETDDVKLLRSIIEALGKVGSTASLDRLARLTVPEQLVPVAERAKLFLERSHRRGLELSELELDRPLPEPVEIVIACRNGLAAVLAEEARELGGRVAAADEVRLDYAGALRRLLALRVALWVGIAWPLASASDDDVLSALGDPRLERLLRTWTRGTVRFRLDWPGAGHRRATTFRVARALRERHSPLLNDPTSSLWTIEVEREPLRRLLLKPSAPELRFDYRVRDVPAASHPTIAAALARLGGAREDDVVWDPFAGSGVELIERARLGPVRELNGTDLDARALAAAAENLASAGVAARIVQRDARHHLVPGLTLVLSNPPMGRRVHRASGLSDMLCDVVRHVARQLAAGGRMVWLSPFPGQTADAARDAGLFVERLGAVDLGGFAAELQRFRKPALHLPVPKERKRRITDPTSSSTRSSAGAAHSTALDA